MKRAIARLLAEDLDVSPDDLVDRARTSLNAAKGGMARAKALSPARRRAIAEHAAAVRLARRPTNGEGARVVPAVQTTAVALLLVPHRLPEIVAC